MNRTDLIKAIAEKIGLTQLCAGSVLEVSRQPRRSTTR